MGNRVCLQCKQDTVPSPWGQSQLIPPQESCQHLYGCQPPHHAIICLSCFHLADVVRIAMPTVITTLSLNQYTESTQQHPLCTEPSEKLPTYTGFIHSESLSGYCVLNPQTLFLVINKFLNDVGWLSRLKTDGERDIWNTRLSLLLPGLRITGSKWMDVFTFL